MISKLIPIFNLLSPLCSDWLSPKRQMFVFNWLNSLVSYKPKKCKDLEFKQLSFTPPNLYEFVACAWKHKLFIFFAYDPYPSVYIYDLKTHKWESCRVPQNGPEYYEKFSIVVIGDSAFLFGGYSFLKRFNDNQVWEFKLNAKTWNLVNTKGKPPIGRRLHSVCAHQHKMYIFGGYNLECWGDLHELDTCTNTWTLISKGGIDGLERFKSAIAVYQNKLFVFGGNDVRCQELDDLWMFDFNTKIWTMLRNKLFLGSPIRSFIANNGLLFMTTFNKCGNLCVYDCDDGEFEVTFPFHEIWQRGDTCKLGDQLLWVCPGKGVYQLRLPIWKKKMKPNLLTMCSNQCFVDVEFI